MRSKKGAGRSFGTEFKFNRLIVFTPLGDADIIDIFQAFLEGSINWETAVNVSGYMRALV